MKQKRLEPVSEDREIQASSHNRRVDVTIEDETANAGSASLIGGIGEFVLKSTFQDRQMDRLSLKNSL